MEVDAEELLYNALRAGVLESVKVALRSDYRNPFETMLKAAIENKSPEFRELLVGAIERSLKDEEFRQTVQQHVRSHLAKVLVQRFGGELEKQVNALKSDPATRARITLAIDEIVSGAVPA